MRRWDKNQSDMPLWTPIMCLAATWRNWGSNNMDYAAILPVVYSFISACSLSICWYFLQFSQPLQQSNCQQKGQHPTLTCVDSTLVPLKPLTCTDLPLFGWPIVATNFSEWVQMFQKNFRGEPILGGSKLNVTPPGPSWSRWASRVIESG